MEHLERRQGKELKGANGRSGWAMVSEVSGRDGDARSVIGWVGQGTDAARMCRAAGCGEQQRGNSNDLALITLGKGS